jgi:hypothetical protein
MPYIAGKRLLNEEAISAGPIAGTLPLISTTGAEETSREGEPTNTLSVLELIEKEMSLLGEITETLSMSTGHEKKKYQPVEKQLKFRQMPTGGEKTEVTSPVLK